MKNLRILFASAAVFVGLASAVAGNRANFFYTNQLNNDTYTKVSTLDASDCTTTASIPCSFTSTTDFGATATRAQLIAAGATASSLKRVYVP
jgi:hypothetical protein